MMYAVYGTNVRENYKIGMEYLRAVGREEDSRNGPVLVTSWPVLSIYERPEQRVLLNAGRDANPFFHFFEGIWMLSGSNDATYLDQFVSDFSSRFAETDGIQHGAYGFRWRYHFDLDQIEEVVNLLKKDPASRRAVISMWDPLVDWLQSSKDIPCNTSLFFRVRNGCLDMMTNCRSNDIIWGAYGANAVHMTMLQEYIATAIGVDLGRFYQNSWNFHAYKDIFEKKITSISDGTWCAPYEEDLVPLISNPDTFLQDCEDWIRENLMQISNEVFMKVALPMILAYRQYKREEFKSALLTCRQIESGDWRRACTEWLQRRIK